MNSTRRTAFLLIGLLLAGMAVLVGNTAPVRLQCENADQPLAVDVPRPRLSWINEEQS